MAHTEPGAAKHTNMGTALDEIARLERALAEERERTTTMTLANDDKRQALRRCRKQNATLLAALSSILVESHNPTVERIAQAAIKAAS